MRRWFRRADSHDRDPGRLDNSRAGNDPGTSSANDKRPGAHHRSAPGAHHRSAPATHESAS